MSDVGHFVESSLVLAESLDDVVDCYNTFHDEAARFLDGLKAVVPLTSRWKAWIDGPGGTTDEYDSCEKLRKDCCTLDEPKARLCVGMLKDVHPVVGIGHVVPRSGCALFFTAVETLERRDVEKLRDMPRELVARCQDKRLHAFAVDDVGTYSIRYLSIRPLRGLDRQTVIMDVQSLLQFWDDYEKYIDREDRFTARRKRK